MKISLVLEDVGAGPQVILSASTPEEALRFYKAHKSTRDSVLALIINPPVELHRKIKAEAKPTEPQQQFRRK
jgi:hypothetical protein